jgi:hypothetical protein
VVGHSPKLTVVIQLVRQEFVPSTSIHLLRDEIDYLNATLLPYLLGLFYTDPVALMAIGFAMSGHVLSQRGRVLPMSNLSGEMTFQACI